MVDHIVRVVADHSVVVYLAGDLAADMWRRRRRWRRGLHVDASLGVVLVEVLVLVVVVLDVVVIVGEGHGWRPVRILVDVVEVACACVGAQLPPGKKCPSSGTQCRRRGHAAGPSAGGRAAGVSPARVPARHAGHVERARSGYSGATAPAGSRPAMGRDGLARRAGGLGAPARRRGREVVVVSWMCSGEEEHGEKPSVAPALVSREPKPEASVSCLVFRLKGQWPVMVLRWRGPGGYGDWCVWPWRTRVCLIKAMAGVCGRDVRGPVL
jgi:hypothetical protein